MLHCYVTFVVLYRQGVVHVRVCINEVAPSPSGCVVLGLVELVCDKKLFISVNEHCMFS